MDYFFREYFKSDFRISLYKHLSYNIADTELLLSFNDNGDWTGGHEIWNYLYLTIDGKESFPTASPKSIHRTKALRNLGSLPGVLEKTKWEF